MEGLFLPLLLMLVVAVPLIMGTRKQKKAAAQQQELQSSLSDGDRVMTTSGLYATVADASDESTIDLEIADGVVTTWLRQAVREKIDPIVEDDAVSTVDSEVDDSATADTSDADKTGAEDDERSKDGAQVAPSLEHGKK
jgi:preprotein translocase subunit YajC